MLFLEADGRERRWQTRCAVSRLAKGGVVADFEGEETGGADDVASYQCENGHTFDVPQHPQGGAAPREMACPVCGTTIVAPVSLEG